MIKFKLDELLKKNNMSRYRLQKISEWNYSRVNSYYFGRVIEINISELDTLCKIFNCQISDIIEYVNDTNVQK